MDITNSRETGLERARRLKYAVRVCPNSSRHNPHDHERSALDVTGRNVVFTAWCPGRRYGKN